MGLHILKCICCIRCACWNRGWLANKSSQVVMQTHLFPLWSPDKPSECLWDLQLYSSQRSSWPSSSGALHTGWQQTNMVQMFKLHFVVTYPPFSHVCCRAVQGGRWNTLSPDWGTGTSCSASRRWPGREDTGQLCSTPTPRASSAPPWCNYTGREGTAVPGNRGIFSLYEVAIFWSSNN